MCSFWFLSNHFTSKKIDPYVVTYFNIIIGMWLISVALLNYDFIYI